MRIESTKKLVPSFLIGILMSSCATYTISEKSAFKATKYDIGLDSLELSDEPEHEKEKFLKIAEKIIDSADLKIIEDEDIALNRGYMKINDSVLVEYFCYLPGDYERTIIFFIGNQSRQTSYVKNLQQLSVETNSKIFSWNYRGYGNSTGNSSFKTQFDDNEKIYSQLLGNNRDEELIFIGYSLGSVFSSKLASTEQPDKLILLAPFSDIPGMIVNYKRQLLRGPKFFIRPFIDLKIKEDYVKDISNIDAIDKFKGDLLIVHSKDDDQLPYYMGKRLYKNSDSTNKKLITVRKGGHGAPLEDENWDKVIAWIKNGP